MFAGRVFSFVLLMREVSLGPVAHRGARELAGGRDRPGQGVHRVWLTSGGRGLIGEPVSLPVLRDGVDELQRLIAASGVEGSPVIGLEVTGALHHAWAAEIERRWPGSLRLFAPSETTAARAQLGLIQDR